MAALFGLMFCVCIFCWMHGVYGETCYEYDYRGIQTNSLYCSGGCCGTRWNQYCCYHYYSHHPWDPIGAIIGGIVGGVVLLALLITCCVCICVKNKGRPGRIVAPTTAGPMVIMSQSHQQPDGYRYPAMPQYPYETGQTLRSTNPGVPSSSGAEPMVPPPYTGLSGGSYPATGGEKPTIPN